jgi:pilus assembly protein CpaC
MKKILFYFLLSCAFITSTIAQDFWQELTDITLYAGQTKVIASKNPERIVIGNPELVDVIKATSKDITLLAKAAGRTTFNWWDEQGEHTINIRVYRENMDKIKERIDRLIQETGIEGIKTVALDSESKVLIKGKVKSNEQKERINTALGQLKDQIINLVQIRESEASVEIDVQVLEMNEGMTENLGFDTPTGIDLTEASAATQGAVTGLSTLFRISDWSRSALFYNLDLQVQKGNARILSRPRLVCRSGKEAELLIGGEVPIITTQVGSSGGEGTDVEYKEYGITLNVSPRVVDGDKIDIGLNIEVSEIGTADTIGSADAPTAKAYPLTKRTVSTEVSLHDNNTLLIGGLIKQKKEEDLKRFPWLADIPVLGAFFRHRSTTTGDGSISKGNTELFITLTPKIIKSDSLAPEKTKLKKRKRVSQQDKYFSFYEQTGVPEILKEYIYNIQQKVISSIRYPESLDNTGWEANLVLAMKLSHTGKLEEVVIDKSSGYDAFDKAAIRTVRQLKYPSFPSNVNLKEIRLKIPMVYRSYE